MKKFIFVLLALLFLLFLWYFNTFTIKINEVTIYSDKIKNDIKIIQISDLHGANFGEDNKKLINKIDKQNPDLIVITGDSYSYENQKQKEISLKLMKNLAEKYNVYFVNGEHDNSEKYFEELEQIGVKVLNYKNEIITVGNTKIHLYGITNVYYSDTFDLHKEFKLDEENYTVLLAHVQNFQKFIDFGVDLSVCGDTHGGQIRLPVIGAIYDGTTWFPDLNGKYVKGLYELNGKKMFISSGVGNYPIQFRFCNRPEIAVINLKAK